MALSDRWISLDDASKPETLQRYNQVIGEWLAAGCQPAISPEQTSVKELLARFGRHAERYYRGGQGRRTSQLHVIRLAAGPLKALYGEEL